MTKLSPQAKGELAASRIKLETLIRKAKLDRHKDAIAGLARPSIRLLTRKGLGAKAERASPQSRFGGVPDLPPTTKWPRRGEWSLAFIAQLRCDELALYDADARLPSSGTLSFFLVGTPDSDEYGDHAVVFHFDAKTLSALVPTPPPEGDERAFDPKHACVVSFRAELSPALEEGPALAALRKKMTDEEHQAYWDEVRIGFAGDGPHHRLLGYPDMNSNYAQKKDELLLQIDSDDEAEWNFGDAQAMRIYISPASLAAKDFRRVRATSEEE